MDVYVHKDRVSLGLLQNATNNWVYFKIHKANGSASAYINLSIV